uniref:Uncharacterized protein n=1 Tax=Cannabis sativa TaxID=3483 RepID=A0A803QC73_CANSA
MFIKFLTVDGINSLLGNQRVESTCYNTSLTFDKRTSSSVLMAKGMRKTSFIVITTKRKWKTSFTVKTCKGKKNASFIVNTIEGIVKNSKEEDYEGDVEVQEIEDQDGDCPDSPSEAEEEGVARPLCFKGYNESREPVFELGDILVEGEDYVTQEFIEVVPHKRQGALGARWVCPPSIVTEGHLKNLEKAGYLGRLECFLPSPNHRTTSLKVGYYAWSGAHTKQEAMLFLHMYFKRVTDYFHLCSTQFTPKGIKGVDLSKKEVEDARTQLEVVRTKLGEVNKKLLATETRVTELTKELLEDEVKDKKITEEELKTEVKSQISKVEELGKRVDTLETTILEIFYDFWKDNPKANFDYLGTSKDMFLDYYMAHATNENPEATTSTSPIVQSVEAPSAQTDPPAP